MKTLFEAKLSTKQRKKLSSSSFCGPGRSFPVPDCKHVKAGLSLLGRYKGPGDKNKIRACIYRKAKSMGCFKGKEGDLSPLLSDLDELATIYRDGAISDVELLSLVTDLADSMGMSDLHLSFVAGLVDQGKGDLAIKVMRNHLGR